MWGSTVLAQGKKPAEFPAFNEGVCDPLKGETPGLHGLCVAFCEAQTCTATVDLAEGIVSFGESCKVSSRKLLDNYNKRAKPGDPEMPCVNVVQNECPCWTGAELAQIADKDPATSCQTLSRTPAIFGPDKQSDRTDMAWVSPDLFGIKPTCNYLENSPLTSRLLELDDNEYSSCVVSIEAECKTR